MHSATALELDISQAIRRHADAARLPIPLVTAIVLTESGGDRHAWNPEPKYRYLVNAETGQPFRKLTAAEIDAETPPADFPSCPGVADDRDAEWWGQAASWGLMQIMGAVARELGFRKHFPALCEIDLGLKFGCAHLAHLRDRFHAEHGWEGVAAAFNAGSPRRTAGGQWENQVYVDKVRKHGGFAWAE